jgi:ureidoglycolate lyase
LETREIGLEMPTKGNFARFGQIIGLEDQQPLEDFPYLKYWTGTADLGKTDEGLDMGWLVCKRTEAEINRLERHLYTSETFFPLVGKSIFVMAPPNDREGVEMIEYKDQIKAFFIDGSEAVSLKKGTWHWPPKPLEDLAKFALLRKGELKDPTQILELGFKVRVIL